MHAFPALMSIGTQRSKELYTRNYILDIDNQTYSQRQNGYHINSYYKRLVNNRLMRPEQKTPLLPFETSLIAQMNQTARQPKATEFGIAHKANLSKTIQEDVPDRMINDPSAMETVSPEKWEEKRTMLPQLAHLNSDDSLFGGESRTVNADSVMHKVKKG